MAMNCVIVSFCDVYSIANTFQSYVSIGISVGKHGKRLSHGMRRNMGSKLGGRQNWGSRSRELFISEDLDSAHITMIPYLGY